MEVFTFLGRSIVGIVCEIKLNIIKYSNISHSKNVKVDDAYRPVLLPVKFCFWYREIKPNVECLTILSKILIFKMSILLTDDTHEKK